MMSIMRKTQAHARAAAKEESHERIVRAKEKQQVRRWRLERKPGEPNKKD